MTTESILLIGRGTEQVRDVLETHRDRLSERADVESVDLATYEHEPIRELKSQFEQLSADVVYAVPMCAAHNHETTNDIPAALSYVPGTVRYCEPIGQSPAVTDVLEDRGTGLVPAGAESSLILVSFGSSSKPYGRQTTDYHATRLREQSSYDTVLTCYLLQNPAVECVRYNVPTSRAVAVPLFMTRTEATEERIPAKLELERGGIQYADPLGEHPRVTDAVHAEVEKQRTLAVDDSDGAGSFEANLTRTNRPMATDGDGTSR